MRTRAFFIVCGLLFVIPSAFVHAQLGPGTMCYEIGHGGSSCSKPGCDYCLTALGVAGMGRKSVGMTYVNTYTQGGAHGVCTGCSFRSQTGTARSYGEGVPNYNVANFPSGPEWQYLARQLNLAKSKGAQVIDIDNVDAYPQAVVLKMYDLAGSLGLRVLAKNVFDPTLLKHGAVAGGLYEPEGDPTSHVAKIARAVQATGRADFPVYVLEHTKSAADAAALAMTRFKLSGGATNAPGPSSGQEYARTDDLVAVGQGGVYTPTGQFAPVQSPDQFFRGVGNPVGGFTGGVVGGDAPLGGLLTSIAGASPGNAGILSKLLGGLGLGGGGSGGGSSGSGGSSTPGSTVQPTATPAVLSTLLGTQGETFNFTRTNTTDGAYIACTTQRVVYNCTGSSNTARITTDTNETLAVTDTLSGDVTLSLPTGRTLLLKCLLSNKVLAEGTCTTVEDTPLQNTASDAQYLYANDNRVIRKKERACQL